MADNFLMKGKVYAERKHLLKWPVWAEVKYDEIRLHVRAVRNDFGFVYDVEFLSYAGKPLHNMGFWVDAFVRYMQDRELNHLDLGVLVNGNFNDSYRWVRSSTGVPKDKFDKATGKTHHELAPSMLQFYLFDVPELTEVFWARKERLDIEAEKLGQHIWDYAAWPSPVKRPEGQLVQTETDLDVLFGKTRERGLEGLMVKSLDHTYETGKRIDGWLKMKPEDPADGRIVKINQAFSIHGEPLDRAGSVDVIVDDGGVASFASPAGIAHELGRDMWEDPQGYIGRWIEFKYMERDRQGGYRHPSFVRFREDKA